MTLTRQLSLAPGRSLSQNVETVPRRVVMVTECSMSDNVPVEFPQIDFVRPFNLCRT